MKQSVDKVLHLYQVLNRLVQKSYFPVVDKPEIVNSDIVVGWWFIGRFKSLEGLSGNQVTLGAHHEIRQLEPQHLRIPNVKILFKARLPIWKFKPSASRLIMFRFIPFANGGCEFSGKHMHNPVFPFWFRNGWRLKAPLLTSNHSAIIRGFNRQVDSPHANLASLGPNSAPSFRVHAKACPQ